jgi:hypothetical protein
MTWDDWDFEGHESRVEYWRSVVPALSVSPERREGRPLPPFALCRGVPSGVCRTPCSDGWQGALDFALLVWTVPDLMPRGALFVDGVPLVIARCPPNQPLANTDASTDGVAVTA